MAVPYVLALHEDFMRTTLALLAANQRCKAEAARVNLVDQHRTFEAATGRSYPLDLMSYITVLRLMRNAVIHTGGMVTPVLAKEVARWDSSQEAGWMRLAKRSPRILQVGDRIDFGQGEMILALAVTKRLDRETNLGLQAALSRECWATMVVEDLLADDPSVLKKPDARRKVQGFARHNYRPLKLTEAELTAEVDKRK